MRVCYNHNCSVKRSRVYRFFRLWLPLRSSVSSWKWLVFSAILLSPRAAFFIFSSRRNVYHAIINSDAIYSENRRKFTRSIGMVYAITRNYVICCRSRLKATELETRALRQRGGGGGVDEWRGTEDDSQFVRASVIACVSSSRVHTTCRACTHRSFARGSEDFVTRSDMSNIDECYVEVLRLVKQAGSIVREKINQRKDVLTKSCDVDLVTQWDQEVERLLINGIAMRYPKHKFIGEESAASGQKIILTDMPTWIIDPIDGTMNFVHGLPHTCISVALLINKTAEIGIVYNPILEQLFTARKGQGAFLNGAPIRVSGEKELRKALLMVEMGTSRDPEKMKVVLENITLLTSRVHGIRSLGSAALNMCMVALGGADISFEFGIHAWDVAAGDLIVREAGGVSIDPAGGSFDVMSRRTLCASSTELAQELSQILIQYYPTRD